MNDIGFTISIILFYLTFGWLYNMRTSQYPYLSRVPLINSKNSPHLKVTLWAYGYILIWIIASALSFYFYSNLVGENGIISLFLGPITYFSAPHTFSSSLTVLIFWKVPDDPLVEDPKFSFKIDISRFREKNKSRNLFFIGCFISIIQLSLLPLILLIIKNLRR